MATRNYHTPKQRLRRELQYLNEAWGQMDKGKTKVYADFLISVLIVGAALYQGEYLNVAIGGATVIMGINFQELLRHYAEAKHTDQTTFDNT